MSTSKKEVFKSPFQSDDEAWQGLSASGTGQGQLWDYPSDLPLVFPIFYDGNGWFEVDPWSGGPLTGQLQNSQSDLLLYWDQGLLYSGIPHQWQQQEGYDEDLCKEQTDFWKQACCARKPGLLPLPPHFAELREALEQMEILGETPGRLEVSSFQATSGQMPPCHRQHSSQSPGSGSELQALSACVQNYIQCVGRNDRQRSGDLNNLEVAKFLMCGK